MSSDQENKISESLKEVIESISDKIGSSNRSYNAGQNVSVKLGGNKGIIEAISKTKIQSGLPVAVVKGENNDNYAFQGNTNQTVINQTVVNDFWEMPQEKEVKSVFSGNLKILFSKQVNTLVEFFVGGHIETPIKIYELDLFSLALADPNGGNNRPSINNSTHWMLDAFNFECGLTNTGKKEYDFIVSFSFYQIKTVIIEGIQDTKKVNVTEYDFSEYILRYDIRRINSFSPGLNTSDIGYGTLLNLQDGPAQTVSVSSFPGYPFIAYNPNQIFDQYNPWQYWSIVAPGNTNVRPELVSANRGLHLVTKENIDSILFNVALRQDEIYTDHFFGLESFNVNLSLQNFSFKIACQEVFSGFNYIESVAEFETPWIKGDKQYIKFYAESFMPTGTLNIQSLFNIYDRKGDFYGEFGYKINDSKIAFRRYTTYLSDSGLTKPNSIDSKTLDILNGLGLLFELFRTQKGNLFSSNRVFNFNTKNYKMIYTPSDFYENMGFDTRASAGSQRGFWQLADKVMTEEGVKLYRQLSLSYPGLSNGNLIGSIFYKENLLEKDDEIFTEFSYSESKQQQVIAEIKNERKSRVNYKKESGEITIWAFNLEKQQRMPDRKVYVHQLSLDPTEEMHTVLRSSFYPDN